jgi:hypothetical protein
MPTASAGRRGDAAAPQDQAQSAPRAETRPTPQAGSGSAPQAGSGSTQAAGPPRGPAAPPPKAGDPAAGPADGPADTNAKPGKARRRWPWSRAARPADAAFARLRAMAPASGAVPPEPRPPAEQPATMTEPSLRILPALAVPGLPLPNLPPLDLPLRPLLEGFLLLALLAGLDVLATGGTGFAHWPVSPFLLPVLYVAARHGLLPGLAVALAAGVLRLGLAVASDVWSTGAWALPLALPLLAAMVGFFTDQARRHLGAARAAAAAAQADRDAIADSNERLAERALELDARLGARLQATTAVFEAARVLGTGTEGVVRGATSLLRAATGCTACSFWLAEDRTLHLVAAEGWPAGSRLAQTLLPGPLTDALAHGRGALVATRLADRLALGGEGILAAPVFSPWDDTLLGMVKIEDIGFADLALDTIASLEAAAGWIGAALAEARAREAAEQASGMAAQGAHGGIQGGGLMVPGEEATRAISVMTGMARRLGFELALLSAEIPAGPRGAAALEATRAAMAEAFRGSDLLLEARLEERRLSVLLPGTAVAGAGMAAARLRTMLAERAPSATTQVVVGVALLHGPLAGASPGLPSDIPSDIPSGTPLGTPFGAEPQPQPQPQPRPVAGHGR